METQNQTHPSRRQLAALALGKLKPDSQARLQEHVASCSTCSNFVSQTPLDTLISLLRAAGSATNASQQSTPQIRDAETLTDIPSGAKSGESQATRPPEPEPNALLAGGAKNDPLKRRVAAEDIPEELRQQAKYRILRLLGRGGMGSVYEAHHELMDRRVAIKTINPSLIDHPEALKRFDQEVKAAAMLDHPNVARAHDADEFGSMRVLVMEFVPGQSWDKFLSQRKQLSVVEACRLVRQAMVGLQHAHDRKLVHRDLKPQNLMLTPDGKVKILDFGLAKVASERRQVQGLTRENSTMGTYEYLAPEQARDAAKADIRADIYSLGCTLYCLLTGAPPFDADTDFNLLIKHQSETPRPLCELRPDVPRALSDLVAEMLAKNPADRPQTPRDAAQALLPFAQGDGPSPTGQIPDPLAFLVNAQPPASRAASSPPVGPRSTIKRQGMWFWSGGAVAVALVLVCAALAAFALMVRTPDGTIIVENVPADADVLIDGHTVTLSRNAETVTVATVDQGEHHLRLVQGGKEIWTSDVKVEFGGQQVRVRYAVPAPAGGQASTFPAVQPEQPVGEVWSQERFPDGEIIHDAMWKVDADGDLVKTGGHRGLAYIFFGDPAWSSYNVEFKAQVTTGLEEIVPNRNAFNFLFHAKDSANLRQFSAGGGENADGYDLSCKLKGQWNGDPGTRFWSRGAAIEQNKTYDVRIEIRAPDAKCVINNVEVARNSDERMTKGRIGLGSTGTDVRFRDIRVTDENGKEIWRGPPTLPGGTPQVRVESSSPQATPPPRTAAFFNGKDLSGWHYLPAYWDVKDGAIVGRQSSATANTFLCSEKTYKDFDLKFKVRLKNDIGNSGVQIRSWMSDSLRFKMTGPQVDLAPGALDFPSGSLITEPTGDPAIKSDAAVVDKVWKQREFNAVTVSCVDKHVTVTLNGVVVVNGDYPSMPAEGHIAWQLHDKQAPEEVTFKDIEFTDLSAATSSAHDSSAGLPLAAPAQQPKDPRRINLLKLIDLKQDVITGEWSFDKNSSVLTCQAPQAWLDIPYSPPAEYDLTITFVRLTQNKPPGGMSTICCARNRQFHWGFDWGNDHGAGINLVHGKNTSAKRANPTGVRRDGGWIIVGQPHTMICKVRHDRVQTFWDGELVVNYETDFQDISLWGKHKHKNTLGLGASGLTKYQSVEVLEITGQGTPLRPN